MDVNEIFMNFNGFTKCCMALKVLWVVLALALASSSSSRWDKAVSWGILLCFCRSEIWVKVEFLGLTQNYRVSTVVPWTCRNVFVSSALGSSPSSTWPSESGKTCCAVPASPSSADPRRRRSKETSFGTPRLLKVQSQLQTNLKDEGTWV